MSELTFLKAYYWAKGFAIGSAAIAGAIAATQAGNEGMLYALMMIALILMLWRLKLPPLSVTTETETIKRKK